MNLSPTVRKYLRSHWAGALALLLGSTGLIMTCETRGAGTVEVGQVTLNAEVIGSPQESRKGLMERKDLPENACALFLVGDFRGREVRCPVWMKDCLIPLDVAWFDRTGKVVALASCLPPFPPGSPGEPPVYGGEVPAWGFLEMRAGTLAKTGLAVGNVIRWDVRSRPFWPLGIFRPKETR